MTKPHHDRDPIAIVGIGCRFPGNVQTPQQFWQMLEEKKDTIGPIPHQRWNVDHLYHPDYRTCGKMHVREGGFLKDIDQFDPAFFEVAPVEANSMDPAQRLLLEHTYLAFEDAGIPLDTVSGSATGVFVGTSASEYAGIMQGYTERSNINAHTNTGSSPAIAANRISYTFNLQGPSFSVDTACSASMIAAHLACRSIWNGESTCAVVAGANLILKPEMHIGFSTAGFLSPDARSKPFDARANGYVRSEGIGVLILKPLNDALTDGTPIYATIIGSATNEDGRTSGIALPNPDAQITVMQAAYRDAGIDPSLVTCVEAHGTGTAAGDPIECNSIGTVIGANRNDTCLLGSVKSNMGHTELASGTAGLIKLALSLKHGMAAPVVHFETPNPKIDFKALHLKVPKKMTPIPRKADTIYGAINSFGFGGANVHLVMQAPPPQAPSPAEKPTPRLNPIVLPISARSDAALKTMATRTAQVLERERASLQDLAGYGAVHRSHHHKRACITAVDVDHAIASLRAVATDQADPSVALDTPHLPSSRTAFVFSGQGPQWFAMGRELMTTTPVYADTIKAIEKELTTLGWLTEEGSTLTKELMADEATSRIGLTHIAQPAIFALQVGLARVWQSLGVHPDAVVGHSIGEVAAAHVSGALSLEEACKVVYWRSKCQTKASGRGRMLAVGLSFQDAKTRNAPFDGKIDIAAINGPQMIALAGNAGALKRLAADLEAEGIFNRFLAVDVPFHSYLLEDVANEFETHVPTISGGPTRIDLYSTVTGEQIDGKALTNHYYARNIRDSVLFYPTIEAMVKQGYTTFIEISPHPILAHGITAALESCNVRGIAVPSLRRKENEAERISKSIAALHVAGYPLDWRHLYPGAPSTLEAFAPYPWQKDRYWNESHQARTDRIGTRVHHHLRRCHVAADTPDNIIWEIELDVRSAPYIGDHKVQGPIVYPGAGHVDLAIAAGRASFGDQFAFLERIEFISPLFLSAQGPPYEVQMHIDTDDGEFTIASQKPGATSWTIHSKGRINHIGDTFQSTPVTLAVLKSRINHSVPLKPLFDVLQRGGLELGKTFRGIKSLHAHQSEALGTIEVHPTLLPVIDQFNIHPTVLDASFQSAFGIIEDRENMGVYIPRRIDRVKFHEVPQTTRIFSYAKANGTDPHTLDVDIWIFDETGRVCAEIQGFKGQYLKGSRGEISGERDALFHAYRRKRKDPIDELVQNRAGGHLANFRQATTALRHRTEIERQDPVYNRFFQDLCPAMDELAIGHLCAALRQLGINLNAGARYDTETAAIEYGIALRHTALFDNMFDHLVHLGWAKRNGSKVEMRRTAPVINVEAVAARAHTDLTPFAKELTFFHKTGAQLAAVLTGEQDPADVLFSTDRWDEITNYYADTPTTKKYNALGAAAVAALIKPVPTTQPLRIMEIGAGTGGLTGALLPLFPPQSTQYLFTDLSIAFLERARTLFEPYPFVEYDIFDIETDPVQQGFVPGSFDMVIASNVIHATRNVAQSLKAMRQLLAPGGVMCLLEVTSAPMYLDLSFGMTDGWWHFEDRELRKNHCTMKAPTWIQAIETAGFSEVVDFSDVTDEAQVAQTIFLARTAQSPAQKNAPSIEPRTYAIVPDNQGVSARLRAALKQEGHRCVTVRLNEAQSDEDAIVFHPDNEPEFIDALTMKGIELDGIVVTAPMDMGTMEQDPQQAFHQINTLGFACLALGRCLNRIRLEHPTLLLVLCGEPGEATHLSQSPLWGMGRVMINELQNIAVRLVDVGNANASDAARHICKELSNMDQAAHVGDEEVFYDNGVRYINTLTQVSSAKRQAAALVETDTVGSPVHLVPSKNGILSESRFQPMPMPSPKSDEILIHVSHTGLNFRDVMVATAALPDDAVEGGFFSTRLGLECAGIVTQAGEQVHHLKVGERVFAIAADSLAGVAVTKAIFARKVPAELTLSAAAGTPMAAMTAYYSLVQLAHLRPGETVLIHSAAGGVGLYAVHIARAIGADVVATASPEKHQYLLGLGVKAVFHSRQTRYYDEIMAYTEGRGVNVVLNSLGGSHITQSLKLLAPMGRFIELGKADFYRNKRIGLRALANNIAYFAVDIDRLLAQAPQQMSALFDEMIHFMEIHQWPQVPVHEFPMGNARNAIETLATGKHQGKLVLAGGPVLVAPPNRLTLPQDGVYLVAGGTRGFGLQVARFLGERGARHIVLASRSGLRQKSEAQQVAAMRNRGINVDVYELDLVNEEKTRALVAQIHRPNRPLRGVFQSTLILDDAMIDKMTPAQFARPLAPKIMGTWNLHIATREIPLDYFVSFSSISSLYGFPGQSNYAAANKFLDEFSHWRRAKGMNAITVNWGALGDVGFVSRDKGVKTFLANNGWETIDADVALDALERILLEKPEIIGVFKTDWQRVGQTFPRSVHSSRFAHLHAAGTGSGDIENEAGIMGRLTETPESERPALVKEMLVKVMGQILGTAANKIDVDTSINKMGIDSLMANQLRSILTTQTGVVFSLMQVMQGPTLNELCDDLVKRFNATQSQSTLPEETGVWITPVSTVDNPKLRLFCLPYMGAGASIFTPWQIDEVEICPIQLPGREERIDHTPIADATALMETIAEAMMPLLDLPYAIYGHSFGGSLAMGLASYLEHTTQTSPVRVFVGAAVPPGVTTPLEKSFAITDVEQALGLSDEVMEKLLEQIGTPPTLLQDRDALQALMPALRADLALTRQRLFPASHKLRAPITAICARGDHLYTADHMQHWTNHTETFTLVTIDGNHLFIHEKHALERLLKKIGTALTQNTLAQQNV